ncbi:ATP phosphoribosyltransferase regulatory subunit [Ornithinibacillus sp. JPR2-1]|uniref:ATP phosphoribosyltransferase regulatory subunit n=1 Tax=Ornithinibacillus sp. JPR2-1 TaxID=2094019 RepID=UPI0031DA89E9
MEPYPKPFLTIQEYDVQESFIQVLKNRFRQYGFNQVKTPAFETYDLYSSVQGTIALDDMIKFISPEGKVLVLRPDVTIPITQLAVSQNDEFEKEARYSYILDVFRTSFQAKYGYVKTQAGVELLGNPHAEADMEVISLAIDCLLDLEFTNFKIEMGHAGVVNEILQMLSLSKEQEDQFKQLIISKNFTGLEEFLSRLDIEPSMKESLLTIPLLYGKPDVVLDKALSLSLTNKMTSALHRLKEVFSMLAEYGFRDYIVVDLGLISSMSYYSDITFQGYIENIGKPVLFGGRYDNLAEQFASPIPAIGFAYDVDTLLSARPNPLPVREQVVIRFDEQNVAVAIQLAKRLRELHYQTILSNRNEGASGTYVITITKSNKTVMYEGETEPFNSEEQLLQRLQSLKEENTCNR